MRTGLTISASLLVLLTLGMLWLLERRARLSLQASGEDTPTRIKRLAAAAEHPDFVRAWIRPTVLCLIGLVGGQLLNLAGCNTTPTQTRLTNLEAKVAEQGAKIVPREEIVDRQHVIELLQAQRDKRIDEIERNYDRLAEELMRRSR